MKVFNEKHEAILEVYLTPTDSAKEGELSQHAQTVQSVTIYHMIGPGKFAKVVMRKEMFIDLAKQIIEIEGSTITRRRELDLPF